MLIDNTTPEPMQQDHQQSLIAMDAERAQSLRAGFAAGPAAQCLRLAVQVVGGLFGRNRWAVHQFQRGELLGSGLPY